MHEIEAIRHAGRFFKPYSQSLEEIKKKKSLLELFEKLV